MARDETNLRLEPQLSWRLAGLSLHPSLSVVQLIVSLFSRLNSLVWLIKIKKR
jgi:hypothetical protein